MKKKQKILTEAAGSLTSGYMIQAIREAGYLAVASDIQAEIAGASLAHEFVLMPRVSDPELWDKTLTILQEKKIDIVFPSLDESLAGWAERAEAIAARMGTRVILSTPQTIHVCQDKWRTFEFFRANGIPTPDTSLQQQFPLVKPRLGRGGKGIQITQDPVDMNGMISQALLTGEEYTIDVFCDHESQPVYIIPRKRLLVRDGKAIHSITVQHPEMIAWVQKICARLPFYGPVNLQCFVSEQGAISFTEINPRLAGGMALAFAASENWVPLVVENLLAKKTIQPKPIHWGMRMMRYYAEVFSS